MTTFCSILTVKDGVYSLERYIQSIIKVVDYYMLLCSDETDLTTVIGCLVKNVGNVVAEDYMTYRGMRWELHIRKASDDLDVQMNEMLDMSADKTDYLILTDVNDQLTIGYITDRMIASVYSIKTYTLDCNALGEYTWRQSIYCNDGRWKYIDSILTYTGTRVTVLTIY